MIFKAICEIDESTYIKFKEKLLSSNIKNIEFDLNMDDDAKETEGEYSEKDLNNIGKEKNIKKFEKIIIQK